MSDDLEREAMERLEQRVALPGPAIDIGRLLEALARRDREIARLRSVREATVTECLQAVKKLYDDAKDYEPALMEVMEAIRALRSKENANV